MYRELKAKDEDLYLQNGILKMLERNIKIKPCPERFQDAASEFDVVITCEGRVFEQVVLSA